MGKIQRQGRKHHSTFGKSTVVRRQHSHQQAQSPANLKAAASPSGGQQHGRPQARVKVPFTKHDNVLLVGEGDFSFSLSLKLHHKVRQMVATCYDSKEVLQSKYPEVQKTTTQLQSDGHQGDEIDEGTNDNEDEWKGFSPSPPNSPIHKQPKDPNRILDENPVHVLYGIDATKLSSAHKKALRPYSPFTKIVFNFPHVGGLSTDVNRQVRYNQELLVGFFQSAKPLLSSRNRPATIRQAEADDMSDYNYDDTSETSEGRNPGAVNGQILVTLFEGEPYTLWNIRDLARHCGLKVVESFKFPWSAYPGYHHARTAGDIVTGKDRSDEGKRRGAWRGEERDARCYVMEDQNAEPEDVVSRRRKRRRKQGSEDSDSD
ncbi:uncharacterized protein Z520_07618 [Fonsecaea multimorphosa CBS 102226]|uniref:25S rRNA (uridine-N(3))-methyltransferase BMT5-like domain-containing protein n=1 Tax=Fonsecaea multimorphosa CBS 102226 TaxID=1442371 RepID=A0A0D2KK12_9EURO|nr:uncharacterized protein Z520_07618 [Fonsecaea multimorphosa CBS 102226]KIX96898.1 hypothetical protein Z520_07618 [Fonsecaea multimorphosa CBS 102226]OAL22574.1 hypothetical protein AYO22_07132 [Fonsecaea multimorphosa]